MNLIPLVSSNFRAARIRPMLPSLIRSASETPWFWYFLATATTKRRLARTSPSSASGSPSRICPARRHSASRSISGYALISRRYWSRDSDSAWIFLGGLNVIGVLRETEAGGRSYGREGCAERRAGRVGRAYPATDLRLHTEHGKAAVWCQPPAGN